MPGCCSHFECSASQQFNQKKVTQELKRYREKGSGPTTRLLVDGITKSGALGGTVLDVGSGIGGRRARRCPRSERLEHGGARVR
jgi:hypothetical protein